MTKPQSPQEKGAKKAAKAARRAAAQSSTPTEVSPEAMPADPNAGVIEEQSSTPPEAAQEPAPEPGKESAEESPTPEPEAKEKPQRARSAKPCRDPRKVTVGSMVRFWLPLAGATAKLITASVAKVTRGQDKDCPPALELNYPNRAGKVQVREDVRHVGHRPEKKKNQTGAWLQGRTGKWEEFPSPPAEEPAAE